jgi:hypothetical protein
MTWTPDEVLRVFGWGVVILLVAGVVWKAVTE